ncbi:AP2-like ethylene-responsive transcription factor CRL5 [Vicia villosa]|uniref:AP2-like ethylene-responsive transcription factor CRL5 n=1 Tax=Vicia villosa TaxID=3911 RepID=UPI00273B4B4F|nr:AP2-like ethylene-responsive transcription factor CRL5 [Vicia villosa]
MKSIENFDSINVNNQNSNMFGVSFSPSYAAAEAVPTSFCYHPTPLHNYGFYYGLESEHVGLYSALPFMPDGSIYGVEALSRSQSPAMSIHPYECSSSKESMQLNMDGFLYNQTLCHKQNITPNNLNHVQENMNLLGSLAEHQAQQLSYYATLRNDNMMLELEGLMKNQVKDSVQVSNIVEDEVFDVKRWVSRDINGVSSNSQSSCVTSSQETSPIDSVSIDTMKRKNQNQTLGQRTSQYRGVTRHRWTGRYEAHLWDNSCKKEGQARKGKQGGYDMEEKAARAYDMAALKYWGPSTRINFPLENYQKELDVMKKMTRQEYVAHLRRYINILKSSGFSRGASMYRGVTSRHHQHGRWQARIGRVAGNKDLYLGTFTTQEEAGEAYDIAAIKFRGENAVTNFDITRYDVEKIIANSNLLSSEEARRSKKVDDDDGIINIEEAINPMHKRCKMQSFSIGLDDIYRQEIEEYSNRVLNMSNASSVVTSLSNSREESPEYRTSMPLPVLFGMDSTASMASFSNLPQMPLSVFAGWADA